MTIEHKLSDAACNGNLELIKELIPLLPIDHFTECISYVLYNAVIFDHLPIVHYWLESYPLENNNETIDNLHHQDSNKKINIKESCLRISAENGNMEITQLLLKYGWNIHIDNDIALRKSSKNGHSNIVKLLINHGANVHVDNDIVFINACSLGDLELVKFLIAQGADIHSSFNPLFHACSENHLDIVRYLIENGADIHLSEEEALKTSCQRENLEIISFLYEQYENKNHAFEIIKSYDNKNITSFIMAKQLQENLPKNNNPQKIKQKI